MIIHKEPQVKFLTGSRPFINDLCEYAARVCTNTQHKDFKGEDFIRSMIDKGHESVIEHGYLTYELLTDRGVTHELVRHRIANFSQSSTRYIKYDELHVIQPLFTFESNWLFVEWRYACEQAERSYFELLSRATPQDARSVLPNSTAATLVITANMREWRHIFKLRCQKRAHPECKRVMDIVLQDAVQRYPAFFDDIES